MDKKTIYKFKCGFMTKKNNFKNKLANIKLNIFHYQDVRMQLKKSNILRNQNVLNNIANYLKNSIRIIIKYAFVMY